jgi:hypothetical protein
VGRAPENPKVVAVRAFPARLLRAKKSYEITKEAEISWAWIAGQVGKSTTVMSQIKTGDREPTLVEVVQFATLLGVRPEWLAFGEGPMELAPSAPVNTVDLNRYEGRREVTAEEPERKRRSK